MPRVGGSREGDLSGEFSRTQELCSKDLAGDVQVELLKGCRMWDELYYLKFYLGRMVGLVSGLRLNFLALEWQGAGAGGS